MRIIREASIPSSLNRVFFMAPRMPVEAIFSRISWFSKCQAGHYPGFAHLRARKANPAAVILAALRRADLETRLAEALPWVLLTYPDLDWWWLIRHAKLHDVQNRLGFLVAVAKGLAADKLESHSAFNPLMCR